MTVEELLHLLFYFWRREQKKISKMAKMNNFSMMQVYKERFMAFTVYLIIAVGLTKWKNAGKCFMHIYCR